VAKIQTEQTIKKQLLYSTKFSKQGNQRTAKEKENIPDLTFQILLKQNSVECIGCLKFFQTMHSRRLEIFRMTAYFDSRFRVRQFPFNPGYLISFSAPNSPDLKIFPFKTNFRLIKGPFKTGFTVYMV
jgi:hypothetical protein